MFKVCGKAVDHTSYTLQAVRWTVGTLGFSYRVFTVV